MNQPSSSLMQSWKTLYPLIDKHNRIQGIFLLALSLASAVLELTLAGSVAHFIREKNTLENQLISLHIEENQSLSFASQISLQQATFTNLEATNPALDDGVLHYSQGQHDGDSGPFRSK